VRPLVGLVSAASALLLGCGATTVRVGMGPTVDGQGKVGVEGIVGLGIGTPLDFKGRSRHYLQVMPSFGGGMDGRSKQSLLRAAADVDYIYWAGPSVDVRGGLRVSYRGIGEPKAEKGDEVKKQPSLAGFGGHFGVLPVVLGSEDGWMVRQLCIGAELHVEYLVSDPAGSSRTLISLPLLFDLTLLGAGD
jgi:hypothetical protein